MNLASVILVVAVYFYLGYVYENNWSAIVLEYLLKTCIV